MSIVFFSIISALIGAVLIVLEQIRATRYQSIDSASSPKLMLPIVTGFLCLTAVGWAIWLVRTRGIRTVASIVMTVVAIALLIATPVFAMQVRDSSRELRVTSMLCDADSLTITGGNPDTGCEDASVETIVLLQGLESDRQWVPGTSTDNLVRTFANLPSGSWNAMLTVDGPESTVAASVLAERDGELIRIGQLRPSPDQESGKMRWTGQVSVHDGDGDLKVLFYESANPAVASARIRFDVRTCTGQSVRTFDASMCESQGTGAALVREQSPDGTRTWRQPWVEAEGTSLVVSNLEERTYIMQPDYPSIQTETQSTDVLIIPAAMEQVESNSLTAPGAKEFEIEITASTGTIEYLIYIFPTGSNFAFAP